MPTTDWLKQEFDYGYDSGNVLDWRPDKVRRSEERRIGGSYRTVFKRAILPFLKPDSVVLELGPGRGSWSRAILKFIPEGKLMTVDYQDVTPWLQPEKYDGRLVCHQVTDNSFSCIEDHSVNFFWSMGVLCHNNQNDVREILEAARPKMKPNAIACHQYGNWDKLKRFGWKRGGVPTEFQSMSDNEIWWPRNNESSMVNICQNASWQIARSDMKLLRRDGLIQLKAA